MAAAPAISAAPPAAKARPRRAVALSMGRDGNRRGERGALTSAAMARAWTLTRATVTLPDATELVDATLIARDGRLKIHDRRTGDTLLDVAMTGAVAQTGRRAWSIPTEIGDVAATKPKGCGCGS